ncbi:glycosyltransferase family 2 protein [Cytobacillus firmus]|uniref:glycosyltransferase family 2 protein n=1 Tax=Cytobacillus firmus TaxID=1399 RepID=UPI0024C158E8|nr:glycosyltransferase [Cytobacillus firmus]WHY61118.1 glycosyltransferase [Cytobacillus firmus]
MNRPELSIVVPVNNVEMYLDGCVNSILEQNFRNFEVILIDDGSTDRSGDICKVFAQKDNRVKVVHTKYSGVSAARNMGVGLAKGDYIGFVDSDDRIDKNMYLKLLKAIKETDSDIAVCKLGREIDGKLINDDSQGMETIKELEQTEAMRELFKGVLYRFSLCNKLFKKSCFENVKFPEGRIHEDLSTTYKLFANSRKTAYINYLGYIYIKRKNSILTSTFNEKRLDAFTGWGEILQYMDMNFPQLTKEYTACFVYGCIDNVYYILNQVQKREEQKRYLIYIRNFSRKYMKVILQNSCIKLKYKYLILLLNYNIKILQLTINTKRFFAALDFRY